MAKNKKQTKPAPTTSAPIKTAKQTATVEAVAPTVKVVEQEEILNPIITLLVTLPDDTILTLPVNGEYSIYDIKNIICNTDDIKSYTCFSLKRLGVILPDITLVKDIPLISTNGSIHLFPVLYSERDLRAHVQRFRELMAGFETTSRGAGIDYGASYYSSLSTSPLPETNNSIDGKPRESVDLTHVFPEKSVREMEKCVKSMGLSAWMPVSFQRGLKGDLAYFTVVTMEGREIEITGSAFGFAVNKSTKEVFNPEINVKFNPILSECLESASSGFKVAFKALKEAIKAVHTYDMISPNIGYYPWCVRVPTQTADYGKTMDQLFKERDVNTLYGSRDWNEDLQSIKELPTTNPSEVILVEQSIIRQHQDYVGFAIEAAQGIIDKKIQTVNLSDCESLEMYVHSNVFFSSGYDPRSHLDGLGGIEAAHVASSKDIDGLAWVGRIGVDSVRTLDTVMIDYKGVRMIAQTIIPGILKKSAGETSPVKYGLVDDESGDVFASDKAFHEVFAELGEKLRMKEHAITDELGVQHTFHTSLESKGILGNDGRRYLLDAYRMTPVDIGFLDMVEAQKKQFPGVEKYSYPHQLCLIRPEVIELYVEYKSRAFERERLEKAKTLEKLQIDEGKEYAIVEPESKVLTPNPYALMRFNTDCFTPVYQKLATNKEEKVDELNIRDLSMFVQTTAIQTMIIEVVNYPSLIPMDSDMLTSSMHRKGINMRYLGKLYATLEAIASASLTIFKTVIKQEMILRAVKTLMRKAIKGLPDALIGSCISHYLNCLFAKSGDKVLKPIIEDFVKQAVEKEDLEFVSMSPKKLKEEIAMLIQQRFRFAIGDVDLFIVEQGFSVLKGVCKKIGIQMKLAKYSFVQPCFTGDDILNMYPIVKTIEHKSSYADNALENGRYCFLQDDKVVGIQVLEESVAIYEQTVGPIHPDTAKAYAQLAMMYFQTGEIDQAKLMQKKGILSVERTIGIDDPETISQYIAMAYFEHMSGNTEIGLRLMDHCTEMLNLICGTAYHIDRASCDTYHAAMKEKKEDFAGALELHMTALLVNESVYGREHPTTVSSYDAIGKCSILLGDFKLALNCERIVYGFYLKKLGPEHEQTKELAGLLEELTQRAVAAAKALKAVEEKVVVG